MNEGVMDFGSGLNVQRYDDSVLLQVELKGVPGPAAFGLHDVEGDALEQVFEGGTYPYAVLLQWFKPGGVCSAVHLFKEFGLVSGRWGVFWARYAKRCAASNGWLILRWFCRAAVGSVALFWVAQ